MGVLSRLQFFIPEVGQMLDGRGRWAPPPAFVFVRIVGYCVECGEPVYRDTGYVLAHGGLGCRVCGVRDLARRFRPDFSTPLAAQAAAWARLTADVRRGLDALNLKPRPTTRMESR